MEVNKTETVLKTKRKKFRNPWLIIIDGVEIECKSSIFYLGVKIDKDLSFGSHTNNVAPKVSKTIRNLSRRLMPNVGGGRQRKRKSSRPEKKLLDRFRSCFHKICNLGRNKYTKGDLKFVKITPPLWAKFFTFSKVGLYIFNPKCGLYLHVTSKSGFEMETTLLSRAFRHKTMEDSIWVEMGQLLLKWMFSAPFLKTATSLNH